MSAAPFQAPFQVVRLDYPLDAATFDALVGAAPGVSLQVHAAQGDDDRAWQAFGSAQVYHITSARDDLSPHWFAHREFLARAPNLLAVSTYGAGFDTVDVQACTDAGVCVMNQAGSNAPAVAEHTLGMLLGLSKRIAESDRRLRRGDRYARHEAAGGDLDGAVIGLVGIGHVGTRVAALARAFGMQVIATDPHVPPQEIERRGARPVSLEELIATADVVSLHCPLDDASRGMFGRAQFAAMKPGAYFITTARGGIHDEAALYDSLRGGHLAGAGLDVWAVEPPPATHPLLSLDNVVGSYHNAGVTRGARRTMATMAANQIVGLARGESPPRMVNPQVWPAFARRYEALTGKPLRQP